MINDSHSLRNMESVENKNIIIFVMDYMLFLQSSKRPSSVKNNGY